MGNHSKYLGIILAAGKGNRLDYSGPKPLLNVLGRPMIDYLIDSFNSASISTNVGDYPDYVVKTNTGDASFYGFDTLGVHPKDCPVQASIATLDWGAYISKEALAKGARITISPWKKFQFNS